jgi:hypothetical protein
MRWTHYRKPLFWRAPGHGKAPNNTHGEGFAVRISPLRMTNAARQQTTRQIAICREPSVGAHGEAFVVRRRTTSIK